MVQETGPRLFLKRLSAFSKLPEDVLICNPSLADVQTAKKMREKKTIIGRLDGTCYYSTSGANLRGLFLLRKPKLVPFLGLLEKVSGENPYLNRRLNSFLDRGSRYLLDHADGLIFQSELSRKMHQYFLGYQPSRVPEKVIFNGVDLNEFKPGKTAAPILITSASIWRLQKRLRESILLANRLREFFPELKLHVLGDFDPLVKKSLESIDISVCVFLGRVPAKDLSRFYSKASVQLSLSIFDPCPNVVCEGLASGLPVVTPRQSGAAELVGADQRDWTVDEGLELKYYPIQTVSGIPTPPFEQYVTIVKKILENLESEKVRARRRAEDALSIKKVARDYADFIASVRGSR